MLRVVLYIDSVQNSGLLFQFQQNVNQGGFPVPTKLYLNLRSCMIKTKPCVEPFLMWFASVLSSDIYNLLSSKNNNNLLSS